LNAAVLRCIIVLFGIGFLIIEIIQVITLKLGYFDDIWNIGSVTSNLLNLFVVVEHVFKRRNFEYDTLVHIASCAVALQWLVAFYWMRLIPEMAFYVTFLKEVVTDITGFVVMFFMCILMFSNSVYIIQTSHSSARTSKIAPVEYFG